VSVQSARHYQASRRPAQSHRLSKRRLPLVRASGAGRPGAE
jgi:hypothetical protein